MSFRGRSACWREEDGVMRVRKLPLLATVARSGTPGGRLVLNFIYTAPSLGESDLGALDDGYPANYGAGLATWLAGTICGW